ncbi:HutD/Ves family protein [Bdellovibrio svalbardensis]|nr:HutD family protein [Bdellovibrio svalbardensis]
MTTLQVLKYSDYKVMPWKNGLGMTAQIDIFPKNTEFPPNSSDESFLWRVSSASVQNNNPFSQFPGCDRYLAVYQGQGLRLNEKDLRPTQILQFRGEDPIQGDLIHGPVLDIGVIYRREKVHATMSFVQASPGQALELTLTHKTHYIFCARGKFRCQEMKVSAKETLIINKACDLQVIAEGNEDLQLYLIQLSLR